MITRPLQRAAKRRLNAIILQGRSCSRRTIFLGQSILGATRAAADPALSMPTSVALRIGRPSTPASFQSVTVRGGKAGTSEGVKRGHVSIAPAEAGYPSGAPGSRVRSSPAQHGRPYPRRATESRSASERARRPSSRLQRRIRWCNALVAGRAATFGKAPTERIMSELEDARGEDVAGA